MNSLEEIRSVFKNNDDFLLAGHVNPDGDAIGSCLGLARALKNAGKQTRVYLEEYNPKFDVLPGKEFVVSEEELISLNPKVFVVLDCADASRMGKAASKFQNAEISVCIDHHISNNGLAGFNYIIPAASSTSELVYNLLKGFIEIDKDTAAALYGGLVTDTGGFRHGCTSPDTYSAAASLVQTGIDFTTIYNELLYRHTEREARAFGKAVQKMGFMKDGVIAFSHLTYEEMESLGVTGQHMDGIVEYLLNTAGTKVSAFFYEKELDIVKVSLRSKEINVSDIALRFNGGGHVNAAGCTVEDDITKVMDIILSVLKREIVI